MATPIITQLSVLYQMSNLEDTFVKCNQNVSLVWVKWVMKYLFGKTKRWVIFRVIFPTMIEMSSSHYKEDNTVIEEWVLGFRSYIGFAKTSETLIKWV